MKKHVLAASLAILLSLSGCAGLSTAQRAWLGSLRSDLHDDVLPKYRKALDKSGRPKDLADNDVKLLEDDIASIDNVLAGGEPPAGGAK